jgi:hypothetical protein
VCVENVDPNVLADKVDRFFTAEGYRFEEGSPTSAVYGRGDVAMRYLAGGLSKRYRFRVRVFQEGRYVRLILSRAMSGWSGGVLGVRAMKSETNRISEAIANVVASSMPPAHAPSASVPLSASLRVCSKCNHRNASGNRFCVECGQPLLYETIDEY